MLNLNGLVSSGVIGAITTHNTSAMQNFRKRNSITITREKVCVCGGREEVNDRTLSLQVSKCRGQGKHVASMPCLSYFQATLIEL